MKITEEELLKRGWKPEDDTTKLISKCCYTKCVDDKYLTLYNDFTNTIDRDWRLHVDNCDFETSAVIDVRDFEHIEKVMEILA
jgi:hypothetical protein